MPRDPAHTSTRRGHEHDRAHHGAVLALIIAGGVIGVLAVIALWAGRQALQTDAWTETSAMLLEDADVQTALSNYLVDELFTDVNVQAELRQALPADARGLAVPATAGLRALADRAALVALQRPLVQRLWAEANRVAHQTMMALVRGDSEVLATTGGVITLNLRPIVERVGEQVGLDVGDRLPQDAGVIEIRRSPRLAQVQDVARVLASLAIILPIVTLLLFALAVYLARNWRREALERVGFTFLAVGVVVLVARGVAGAAVVDSLNVAPAVEPAARSVWEVGTSLLRDSAWALVAYGVVILLGAWLAGPARAAMRTRERIAPVLRERRIGYAVLALIVVLVFWWNPTPGTERLLPGLILVVLAVAGLEALRRVSLRDAVRPPARPLPEAATRPPERRAG